jgi:nucleoside-diphosphate-sugar epimerase
MSSRQIAETVAKALGRSRPGPTVPMWLALAAARPFDLVIALTGRNLPISSMRVRKLFRDQTKFEADKLLATGFRSAISLSDGIDRMVRWYVAEGRGQQAIWRQPPAAIQRFSR